jgi:hypothetical protein
MSLSPYSAARALSALAVAATSAACGDYYENAWGERDCERDSDCPEHFYCDERAEVCVHEATDWCPWPGECPPGCDHGGGPVPPDPIVDAGVDASPDAAPSVDAGADDVVHDATPDDTVPDAGAPDASTDSAGDEHDDEHDGPDAAPGPDDATSPDTDGTDVDPVEPECLASRDCSEGQVCVDALCIDPSGDPACVYFRECAEGEGCVDGACRVMAAGTCRT